MVSAVRCSAFMRRLWRTCGQVSDGVVRIVLSPFLERE